MMRNLLFVSAVAAIAALGMSIDVRSRTPAVRSDVDPSPRVIFASGRVEGAAPEAELRTQLPGRVVAVLVQEGQTVRGGDVLLRLDDGQYRQELALANAEVEMAKAQLQRLQNGAHAYERDEAAAMYRGKQAEVKRAALAWQRIDQLRQQRAIAQQEADDQSTLVEMLTAQMEAAKAHVQLLEAPARADEVLVAMARIAAAEARRDLAQVNLSRTELRALGPGRVLRVGADPGELTGPDAQEPPVILADTSKYHVRAFVEELEAPRVRVGMAARIVVDGLSDRHFSGRVTRLSPRMGKKQLWNDHPAETIDTKTREVWIELAGAFDQNRADDQNRVDDLVIGLRVDVVLAAD